ncbi:MAG: sulfurtransferase TusA family protein [Rhodospirillaceae bacterium]|nr:sulfurtransferase TusA family protein [Rhodospirillaceae bacterium]
MDDPDLVLDARGLKCPLPVLKARKRLNGLASGAVLTVLASDPAARKDFAAFCEAAGHALDGVADGPDDATTFTIRRK